MLTIGQELLQPHVKKLPRDRFDCPINLRVTPAQKESWEVAAAESGMKLSTFLRNAIDYTIVHWVQTQQIHNSGGHKGGNHTGKLSELLEQLFPSKRN